MFCQLNSEFDNVKLLSAQVGVGLMIFQQLGGINGVGFYASYIFTSAGTQLCLLLCCLFLITVLYKYVNFIKTSGFSGKLGTILIGIIQV
jgi:MFS transporter, SP family, ERD6-like sugar transporter